MGQNKRRAAIGLMMGIWVTICGAEEVASSGVTKEQFRALDNQVLELKNEVLDISGKLTQFQENFIYPADTRFSVFISLDEGDLLSFAAVKIKIDGKEAANQTYSPEELGALRRGGVHRIFTGSLPAGGHMLDVALAGEPTSANDDPQHAEYKFTKVAGTKVIEIILAEPDSGKRISFRE